MSAKRLLENLNAPQKEAVSAELGNSLVLAGAGSGKTRVLVHRIAWLIEHAGLPLRSILAVTFTNKAAGEMRQRLEATLGISTQGMWVGTFHSIAHRMLRLHYQQAGLSEHFQILDSDDQLRLIKRLMKALNVDEEKWPAKQTQWFINGKKDEGLRPKHLDMQGDRHLKTLIHLYEEYEQACARAGVIDFAEILLRAHELLLNHADLLSHYQSRFQAVLVDEFQDTNAIQYAWLRLLAGGGASVTIVGDDDQSIYGWRGAKIENIHRFSRDFSDVKTIRLEQNYRSTGTILQAANALIGNNEDRLGKSLWTASGEGKPISVYCAFNELDEARFICERIALAVEEGECLEDIAILYRSNAQSRVIEEALIKAGIAYRIYGGMRFFERAEIKDVMGYLRLLASFNDDAAFERVVNLPARGIGERTLTVIRNQARTAETSLFKAAQTIIEQNQLSARAHNALNQFLSLIHTLKEATAHLSLAEQVEHVITSSGLKTLYGNMKGETAQAKLENMQELVSAAKQFQEDEFDIDMSSTLAAFIAHAALEAGEGQSNETMNAVQLMTMHSAKGLEFSVVFLSGMEDGLFPSHQSNMEAGRLQEERRLCYVGMTRACKQLILTYAEIRRLYGREMYQRPSRFLQELPPQLLETVRVSVSEGIQGFSAKSKRSNSKSSLAQEDKSGSGLQLGQYVSHPKFGEGVVTNFEGSGANAKIEVKFTSCGSKWLMLAYAKLSPKECV